MGFNFLNIGGRTPLVASCDICGSILKSGEAVVHVDRSIKEGEKAVPTMTCKGRCDKALCESIGGKTPWVELQEAVYQLCENTGTDVARIKKQREEIGYCE